MTFQIALTIFLAGTLAVCGMTGCKREEGPMQKIGREVDDAVSDVGDKEKSTAEKVGEEIRELGDRIEDNN